MDEASVYTYDKTGQLKTAQMTFEVDEGYAYDANGNRTSGGSKSNGAHKNLIVEDAKYTFEYDGENNRTKRTEKATGNYQEYVWDHRNRLIEVRFKTAAGVTVKTVRYAYDASDMKVREEVVAGASNIAKYFVYDGGNVVLDFVDTDGHATGAASTLDKRYFQGPGVDQLLAQERFASNVSQQVLWILPDHLGSTRDLVDTLGKVVSHYQYDSFGVLLDGRENVTRYQFTGREHDSNTDLNYHRARWFDPLTGKWISEDPIGLTAGDPNFTRMVGNNVLNATDPSGLVQIGIFFEGSGFLVRNDAWQGFVMHDLFNEYQADRRVDRWTGKTSYGDTAVYYNFPIYWVLVNWISVSADSAFRTNLADAEEEIVRLHDAYVAKSAYCLEPFDVDLFGYSRGGVAAITLANRLWNRHQIEVRFLGIIDPVTTGLGVGAGYDTIPTNYTKAYWAVSTIYSRMLIFQVGQILPPAGFAITERFNLIHERIGADTAVYNEMYNQAKAAGVRFK